MRKSRTAEVFCLKNDNDKRVTVSRLEEAHRVHDESSPIESVRTAPRRKNRRLRPSRILAELNVGAAKLTVLRVVGRDVLRVKHDPTNDAPHACVTGYDESDLGSDRLYKSVAAELALLANDRTHPAVVQAAWAYRQSPDAWTGNADLRPPFPPSSTGFSDLRFHSGI